jgi:hypothetical protein
MSEEIMRQNMLAIAQTYASAKNQALPTVSKAFHGNQAFLGKYLAGEVAPTTETYWRMMDQFRQEWPEGVEWPKLAVIGD